MIQFIVYNLKGENMLFEPSEVYYVLNSKIDPRWNKRGSYIGFALSSYRQDIINHIE